VTFGADTLIYRKGSTPGLWSDAGIWNLGIVPSTVNRVAVFNPDSITSGVVDSIKASVTIGGMQFLGNYTGSIIQTGAFTFSPLTSKQFIIGGASVPYFYGSSGQTFRLGANNLRDTLNYLSATTGTIAFSSVSGGNGKIVIIKCKAPTAAAININPNSPSTTIHYQFLGDTVSGVVFNPGVNGATTTDTLSFGSGLFDFQTINFSANQTGTSYQYWQTARFQCGGNLTRSTSATTVTDVGTSKFVFDSTTTTIMANLSGTRIFYDIEVAKTAAAVCSTATATDTIRCNEMRITSGRLAMIAPLYCNSYLNLSTDTSRMGADKFIATSFYRASTANARADTFKTYFTGAVNHDISCDTNITIGRFIVQAGRATALTNLRLVKFTLPVASKLTITAGKIVRIDSAYDIEGTAGNLDSVVSGTAGSAAKLWLPANDTLSYTYVKDINSTDTIYLDSTCRNGGGNTNVYDVSYCTGPSIVTHPASTSAAAPATASFSVAATGDAPLSYQWQKSSVDISGATASSYTTPRTNKTSDNGSVYRAIVSNACGADTSNNATLTVRANPGNKWKAFQALRASAFIAP
jgi:hypothetical protein